MFRPSGECVLIDFGLSHHNQLPDLLQEEFRLPYGTAPYMAPERLLGVRDDPRSDLFSLGVLLYFFTTGVRPFGESETLRGMRRRLWRDPYPPRKLKADYPPWLQEIVLRCLEIEPVWRHPTASQLAFDLAHPDQVKLTARSERLQRDPLSTVWRRRFNPGDDRAEAEIGCRGPTGFGADRGGCARHRGGIRNAQRIPAPRRRAIADDLCRPRGSPACMCSSSGSSPSTGRSTSRATTSTSTALSHSGIGPRLWSSMKAASRCMCWKRSIPRRRSWNSPGSIRSITS